MHASRKKARITDFYQLCERTLHSLCYVHAPPDQVRGDGNSSEAAPDGPDLFSADKSHALDWNNLDARSIAANYFNIRGLPDCSEADLALALILEEFIRNIRTAPPKRELINRAFPASDRFLRNALHKIVTSGNAGKYLRADFLFLLAEAQSTQRAIAASLFRAEMGQPCEAGLESAFFTAAQAGKHDAALEMGQRLLAGGRLSGPLVAALSDCCLKRFFFRDGAILAAIGAVLFASSQELPFLALRQALLAADPGLSLLCLGAFALKHPEPAGLERNRIGMKLDRTFGAFDWKTIFSLVKSAQGSPRTGASSGDKTPDSTAILKVDFAAAMQNGRSGDAGRLLNEAERKGLDVAEQRLEFYLRTRSQAETARLLEQHGKKEIAIGNTSLLFYGHFACGKPGEAFRILGTDAQFNTLNRYYRDRIVPDFRELAPVRRAVILSECYTADELYYSRFYPEIRRRINAESVTFTCDPRSLPVLKRTFPDLDFLPCCKARELEFIEDMKNYDELPGSDCIRYLDNRMARECEKADRLMTVMAALGSVITGYDSYRDLPQLKVDEHKKRIFRNELECLLRSRGKKFAVGLGWRSYIDGSDRKQCFLSEKLFSRLSNEPDILWINCQYDGLHEDEHEFFKAWPDNFIDFDGVDQLNDIDSTGALYAALDLMVAAPTFTADYAAAVGTPVLCPANDLLFKSYCFPGTNINCILPACEFHPCRSARELDDFIALLRRKLSS